MKSNMEYYDFLQNKSHSSNQFGFKPVFMPDFLFDFQKTLVDYAIRKGRSAIFADCGLGKTPIYLVWAKNIIKRMNKPVLILTPLAVATQTVKEGKKFNIDCEYSKDGKFTKKIVVTNYERLHYFNKNDFIGVVCDESSILKNFDGTRKAQITNFMKKIPYRLLCTATAAPNDYIELGTSSEALGEMGYMDMLGRFFKNTQNTCDTKRHWASVGGGMPQWRFKKHAEKVFWQWVSSWSMSIRKPSDIGFDDADFTLPELIENQYEIKNVTKLKPGRLFAEEVRGMQEQRVELAATCEKRCEKVAEIVQHNDSFIIWCQLNKEGDLLEKLIPDAVQVAGKHSDTEKEQRLSDFTKGKIRGLITKPKISGFGMNWQHCNHMTFFPSHSYEQYYQGVRRCWRFGQKRPVTVDIITTTGMLSTLRNLQKKSKAADTMFTRLVQAMNDPMNSTINRNHINEQENPGWL